MHGNSVLAVATVLIVASAHSVACGGGLDGLTPDDFEPIEYNADRLLVGQK